MVNNQYLEKQQEICKKYSQDFFATSEELRIGISDNVKSGIMPINGLRHPRTRTLNGWYIWSGEDFNPEEFVFFLNHLM